jgi:hypothetical protein
MKSMVFYRNMQNEALINKFFNKNKQNKKHITNLKSHELAPRIWND